jgi:hypothetical protein
LHILINDKPVDSLTPRVEKCLMLAKVHEQAKGTVMTAADATNYYISHTKRWFAIMGTVAVVLIVGIISAGISYEPRNAPTFILFALVLLGVFGLFMWWLLRRRIRTWNKKLEHRGEGLLPSGTQVSYDANGLTLGTETFAWPTLAVEQAEIALNTALSGDTSETIGTIERLSLRASSRTFTLDRQMMQNGLVLVDNVWRKVRPKAR